MEFLIVRIGKATAWVLHAVCANIIHPADSIVIFQIRFYFDEWKSMQFGTGRKGLSERINKIHDQLWGKLVAVIPKHWKNYRIVPAFRSYTRRQPMSAQIRNPIGINCCPHWGLRAIPCFYWHYPRIHLSAALGTNLHAKCAPHKMQLPGYIVRLIVLIFIHVFFSRSSFVSCYQICYPFSRNKPQPASL